jgi:protein-tyrosine phosphatase
MVDGMAPQWIELDGTVNSRDLGGLPLRGGGTTRSGQVFRSDNLQGLSDADVRLLVDDLMLRTVADLRTEVEIDSEGPGPLTREPLVEILRLSLFPERGENTDLGATDEAPEVLPWSQRRDDGRRGVSGVYHRYLQDRPDSIIGALRAVAHSPGATIIHCAAGKDRTGTVVALGLAEVGVGPDAIVADYEASAERIDAIMARLRGSKTYEADLAKMDARAADGENKHRPVGVTMERFLVELDELGGASAWLRSQGWSEADAAALRAKLVGNG